MKVSVIGAGTMGAGIAQIAATNGHEVCLFDSFDGAIETAESKLKKILDRLVEKERITQKENEIILGKINFTKDIKEVSGSGLVIEAIIENLDIKQKVFSEIESLVEDNCIIASNTSSLSIASIASACNKPDRVVGIHFFNPAPLMPLVEIIPSVQTSEKTLNSAKSIIDKWRKVTVIVKDTPGFIVNRVARPFYGEAIRVYEEGIADFATIDWAMREIGGFRMGPFQLMDYIGNDINYTVTETVFTAFYFDSRYKPSFTQKRMMEAGYLGRKSGRGYYDYSIENTPKANENRELGQQIVNRILVMLINEAADALFLNIATKEDIDLAMTKGVNYPKGLLAWADEIGISNVLKQLEELQNEYGEDRYRPSPLLKRMVKENRTFY
ncbi:MAG: 3-hydroxybutyryl-CoA dehydrogenase [Flavobacteriales bacterium]|nr:3-hydroxybutyryl-CoA dehydrogenase [Flavobacteriales bacterium]MBT6014298.1 3-hydroxybutyryl-CoA dehydrogenase [Flavobacteriales bacterium]MBT7480904.1 3-hydroxybutyryl-CoA dehydrogenase [Flavobacteriales bacterium]